MGQKYASYDSSGVVNGFYDSEISPSPSEITVIPITESEWQSALSSPYQPVMVVNGALTIPSGPTLAQAKASQIILLQSAFQQAEQAPVSITMASGVTTSFGMTPHDWTKIVGLYSKYVAKGVTVPSGYQIPDVNGVLQAITVADIENLFDAGEAQMTGAISKLASLVGQIESATTVSDVQAIVF